MPDPRYDAYLDSVIGNPGATRFFDPNEANAPTIMMAKALVLEVLEGRPPALMDLLGAPDPDPDYVPDSLRGQITWFMRYAAFLSLLKHLHHWVQANGAPKSRRSNCWKLVVPQIHWRWIAIRLRKEWRQHKHRAFERAQEIRKDMPFELIEHLEDVRKDQIALAFAGDDENYQTPVDSDLPSMMDNASDADTSLSLP